MKIRKTLSFALALIMSLSLMAVPAFAAEVAVPAGAAVEESVPLAGVGNSDGTAVPLSYSKSTTVPTNGTYTTVAQESGGFGCNVTIFMGALDVLNYKVDVALRENLISANPTTSFSDFFGINSHSNTIYVPSNIKYIQLRISPRSSLTVGGVSSYVCTVTVDK